MIDSAQRPSLNGYSFTYVFQYSLQCNALFPLEGTRGEGNKAAALEASSSKALLLERNIPLVISTINVTITDTF